MESVKQRQALSSLYWGQPHASENKAPRCHQRRVCVHPQLPQNWTETDVHSPLRNVNAQEAQRRNSISSSPFYYWEAHKAKARGQATGHSEESSELSRWKYVPNLTGMI